MGLVRVLPGSGRERLGRAAAAAAGLTDALQHWLLVRGRGERRLSPEVSPEEIRAHSSTRRPAVEPGDLALLYAAGWKVVFAVVEVGDELEHDPARARWGWRFTIRPLLVLADLRHAPPVQAAGVLPRSLGRHSYVRLTPAQFESGRAAIEAEAG